MDSPANSESKRTSLESLSKEELLQKCKALLSIAQRAKAAKDEALEQSRHLKEELDCVKKDKSKGDATNEMLEALTAQKLQLTIELDELRQSSRSARNECEGLRGLNSEQEVQIESLRRQLGRAEDDCNALETRLERLDVENRRLAAVANEAEAQLRRGAAERQDVLEGLGDELANVKNAAAEALAERDRLRVQLQQQSPSSNFQTLESCQLLAQELRSTQSLLRADVTELQSAARTVAAELGEALAEAQEASETAARHRSKDLLAQMNEAMKTRGEVAAQLAEKLSDMTKERDSLLAARQEHSQLVNELEDKSRKLEQANAEYEDLMSVRLTELQDTKQALETLKHDSGLQIEKESARVKEVENLKEEMKDILSQKEKLEILLLESKASLEKYDRELELKNVELQERSENISSLDEKIHALQEIEEEKNQLSQNLTELQIRYDDCAKANDDLQKDLTELNKLVVERDSMVSDLKQQIHVPNSEPEDSLLQIEIRDLKSNLKKVKDENECLTKTITEMQEKLGNFETLCVDNKLKQKVIEELEKAKSVSEAAISSMLEDLKNSEKLVAEKEKLEQKVTDLKNNEKYLVETQTTLKLELENYNHFKAEQKTLLQKMEELTLKNQEMQASASECEKNVTTIQLLEQEKMKLSKEMSELKDKNKELIDLSASLKEKVAEMEREDCEAASVSTVSRSEDSARLRDVEESFEERYTKLRAVAVKLKQKCHDQANVLTKVLSERTELQNKLSTLNKERETLAKNVQSMQVACDAATDEAEAANDKASQSNKELKRAGEELARSRNQYAEATEKMNLLEVKLQQALSDLETARQANKKSSMLNLEMAAYEKSAEEQERKLSQLKDEVEALKAEIECQKSVAQENGKEAKHWQELSKQLTASNSKIEEHVNQLKGQLSELQDQFASESKKYTEAVARFEAKRSELERVELQLAEVTAEKLRNEETAKIFKEQAARQIHILEEQVNSTVATVKAREDELSSLRGEFEGYKVRAQAVLHRQQQQLPQKEDSSKDAERENELAVLKTTVERLQTALCDSGTKEKSLQAEITVLTGQNSAIQTSARNLASQVAELNAKCEELGNKLHRSEDAIRDVNRQHRLALDTLSSSYKQQLSDAENRHKAQIASIQAAREELVVQTQNSSSDQEQPVLQQREEGEGSENVDSPKVVSADSRREPLPLDRLLSSSSDYHDDTKSELSFDAASMSSMVAAEKRTKHLSALLGEAEADLARLTQQNCVLKEEIRRQQRCMERQQHTHSNGEYLKNVVLKFVTLQGGDERARLVPVLNTILKLSPEETQQLQSVATGTVAPQSAGAVAAGWGSYLHLWSGTH